MKKFISLLTLAAALSASPAFSASHAGAPMAGGASCDAQAADKKLAGAAKTSFLKKCNADHGGGSAACEKSEIIDGSIHQGYADNHRIGLARFGHSKWAATCRRAVELR